MAIPLGAAPNTSVATLGAPTTTSASGPLGGWSQVSNGKGGYNYYDPNGQPATVQQYGAAKGMSPDQISALAAQGQPAPTAAPASPGGGGTGGGSTVNQAGLIAGLQQEYGGTITGAENLEGQNQTNLGVQEGDVNATAEANANQINANAADANNTLEGQKSGVTSQQKLSLAELADEIRGENQGLEANLGSVGAGFSSAVGAGQKALANVQNTNRANINEQANTNVTDINNEEQAARDQQTTALQQLDAWKTQQIHQILQNYMQIQTQLQEQIQQAQGEQKARLAEFGVSIQSAATDALTAVDATVKQQVGQIMGSEQAIGKQIAGNVATAAPAIATPAVYTAPKAVTTPTISPFAPTASEPGATGNTTAAPTGGSIGSLIKQFA